MDKTANRIETILDVATRLFATNGYHGTSMRDLGEVLDLHAGSIYAHFSSKEEILFQIVDRFVNNAQRDVRRITKLNLPPAEKLHAMARAHMLLIANDLAGATVYFHEWRHLEVEHRDAIIAKRDGFESAIKTMISAGITDHIYRPRDVSLTTKAFLGMLNWTYEWYSPQGPLSPEQVAEEFANLVVDAMMATQTVSSLSNE